jgi:cytochrome P450
MSEKPFTVISPSDSGRCPIVHARSMLRLRRPARRPRGVTTYGSDIFSRQAILDPYPHYAALRALGPVVWLEKQRVYALPRYAEVRQVLSEDGTFRSADGVALNPVTRLFGRNTTLSSDGEVHRDRRRLIGHRLTPRALRPMQADVDELADRTVRAAIGRQSVDGVADIALALPLTVVPDLVGWPERGRDRLVDWAGATFDTMGPANRLWLRSMPATIRMMAYVQSLVRRRDVLPGSMGAEVLQAVDDGRVSAAECPALIVDYLAPSIDTTASAIAAALWLFARHPEQWRLLQDDPSLVPGAVQEVIRLESPLRAFGRLVHEETTIAGTALPAGSRLLVLYASANRDDRVWDAPDQFDVSRDAAAHLGFGYGVHGCAGQGLARMETQAVLRALLRHVDRIELAGRPEFAVNNVIRRLGSLPVRLVPRSNA